MEDEEDPRRLAAYHSCAGEWERANSGTG